MNISTLVLASLLLLGIFVAGASAGLIYSLAREGLKRNTDVLRIAMATVIFLLSTTFSGLAAYLLLGQK